MSNVSNKIAMAKTVIAGLVSLLIGRKAVIRWGQHASCGPDGVISLPIPKTGLPDEISVMTRQAVHEAGHYLDTDFTNIGSLSEEEKALLNALEDPRIERLQMGRLPGASLVLNRGLEEMIEVINARIDPDNPEHAAALVTINVLMRGWLKIAPHEAIVKSGAEVIAKGDKVLGQQGVECVKQATEQLAYAKSTDDAIALARGLLHALRQPEPEQQMPPEQKGEEQGQSEAEPEGEPQGNSDGDESASQEHDTSAQETADSQASQEQSSEPADGGRENDAAPKGQGADAEQKPGTEKGGEQGQGPGDQEAASASEPVEPEAQPQGGDQGQSAAGQDAEPAQASSSEGQALPQGDASQSKSGSDASSNEDGQIEAQGSAGMSSDPQGKTQTGDADQGRGQLNLAAASDMDLGKLLAMAYEARHGAPDVNAAENEAPTESSDEVAKVLARSLQQAQANGQDLESALEEAEAAIEAFAIQAEGESQSLPEEGAEFEPAAGAGGGNGRGTSVSLDIGGRLSGPIGRLVRVFTKELQGKRRRPVKYAPAGGELAVNRLWRLKRLGDPNVFRVMHKVTGIDAAAKFLLDRSGSMAECIQEAAEVALVCAQALERIQKVKTSIEMFPGHADDDYSLITLQPFGMSARQAASRLTEVDAGGGTPLAEALALAVPDLLMQRVQKHLLFVITDGIPNFRDLALLELKKAQMLGVDVFGIGIGPYGGAILELVEDSVHVNDVSELPDAMEKLFRGQLAYKLAA